MNKKIKYLLIVSLFIMFLTGISVSFANDTENNGNIIKDTNNMNIEKINDKKTYTPSNEKIINQQNIQEKNKEIKQATTINTIKNKNLTKWTKTYNNTIINNCNITNITNY